MNNKPKLTARDGLVILQSLLTMLTLSICLLIVAVPIVRVAFTWSTMAGSVVLFVAMCIVVAPILSFFETVAARGK